MSLPPAQRTLLAQACLEYLRHEFIVQQRLHAFLCQQHNALFSHDFAAMLPTEARQQEVEALAHSIVPVRDAFRRRCAGLLGIPEGSVTLQHVANEVVEPWKTQVQEIRNQIRELALTSDDLRRRIHAVLSLCTSATRSLLDSVYLRESHPERYGRTGVRVDSASTSAGLVAGVM